MTGFAGINRLEQLAMNDSPVHRLHPMSKLLTTVVYAAVVISFPEQNLNGLLIFLFYPVVLMSLSDTPYQPLLSRLALALPFSLAGGLSCMFLLRDTAFYIGGFAVSNGMIAFAAIMLRTLLTVMSVLILAATTTFAQIGAQLAVLRIPDIVCLQFVMTYRYLSALADEALAMYTAYTLRTGGGIKMKDMGVFLGQLILRSFDRAERIYHAMKCRGFQGLYYSKTAQGFGAGDWLMLAVAVGMVVLRVLSR